MADYQQALDIFNETVANLNRFVDAQRIDTISELSNMQAQSSDPMDTGAYNLTMYGIDQIGLVNRHVMDTVGNVSNYFIDNSSTVNLQTEHTAVASSLASAPVDSISSLFSHVVNDPGNFIQANSTGFIVLIAVFSLLLGKFIFLKR